MCYGLMIYSLTDSFSLISQCWLGQVEVRSAPRGPSARRTPLHVCDPALSTNVSNDTVLCMAQYYTQEASELGGGKPPGPHAY